MYLHFICITKKKNCHLGHEVLELVDIVVLNELFIKVLYANYNCVNKKTINQEDLIKIYRCLIVFS